MIDVGKLRPGEHIVVEYGHRNPPKPITERVWVFDVACDDGGAHTITGLIPPIHCATCGVEADERERKAKA